MKSNDTIAAIATGKGGAIAVIRLSGGRSTDIAGKIFSSASGRSPAEQKGFSILYGTIVADGEVIDDVLVSVFRAPKSYTGEDMVEISCHASGYIQQKILELCIGNGARTADAGEFTMRAFMNGKMDLSQAEAVADLIAADSKAAHRLAVSQMRGNYSEVFRKLREQLIELMSLLELELDFSEEEVEFADRSKLSDIISLAGNKVDSLLKSFSLGNVIKNGIPVVITGAPNAGKSTLLNAILKEEKALVSEIPGTTRDAIEDTLNIGGAVFRFVDTAGIRLSDDTLENMGIEKTMEKVSKASVILFIADAKQEPDAIVNNIKNLKAGPDQTLALLLNKTDTLPAEETASVRNRISNALNGAGIPHSVSIFCISAKQRTNLDKLFDFLSGQIDTGSLSKGDTVVYNARHFEALSLASESLKRAKEGIVNQLPNDLLAQDIREALVHLGVITGEITSDDILGSIFSRFCIGK